MLLRKSTLVLVGCQWWTSIGLPCHPAFEIYTFSNAPLINSTTHIHIPSFVKVDGSGLSGLPRRHRWPSQPRKEYVCHFRRRRNLPCVVCLQVRHCDASDYEEHLSVFWKFVYLPQFQRCWHPSSIQSKCGFWIPGRPEFLWQGPRLCSERCNLLMVQHI